MEAEVSLKIVKSSPLLASKECQDPQDTTYDNIKVSKAHIVALLCSPNYMKAFAAPQTPRIARCPWLCPVGEVQSSWDWLSQ